MSVLDTETSASISRYSMCLCVWGGEGTDGKVDEWVVGVCLYVCPLSVIFAIDRQTDTTRL